MKYRPFGLRNGYYSKKPHLSGRQMWLFVGGERGIRTPERVLAVTRFPVVRLRPAQPSLRVMLFIFSPRKSSVTLWDLNIITNHN